MDELERQLERGAVFTHTVLSEQAERANENEAVLNGLIDVLVKRGLVSSDELLRAIEAVRQETAETKQLATIGAAIRVDGEPTAPAPASIARPGSRSARPRAAACASR